MVELTIIDRENKPFFIKAIVVDQVATPLDDKYRSALKSLHYLKDLDLAHPCTGGDAFDIQILIGADFYWSIVKDSAPVRGNGPTAVRSRIGYLVSGPLPSIQVEGQSSATSLKVTVVEDDVIRLWSLESVGVFPHLETSEEVADYAKKHIEYRDGKYVAKFPWKIDHLELPSNFKMVSNMTRATIRRLARNPALLGVVHDIIRQQHEASSSNRNEKNSVITSPIPTYTRIQQPHLYVSSTIALVVDGMELPLTTASKQELHCKTIKPTLCFVFVLMRLESLLMLKKLFITSGYMLPIVTSTLVVAQRPN